MPNLDFGLIQFGRSASLKFDVVNESCCVVSFQLQQVVKEKKIFMVSVYNAVYCSSPFQARFKCLASYYYRITVVLVSILLVRENFSHTPVSPSLWNVNLMNQVDFAPLFSS